MAAIESTRSSKALDGRGAGLVVADVEVVEDVVFGEEAGEGVGEREVVGGEASLEVVLERGGLSWRVRPGAILCGRGSVFGVSRCLVDLFRCRFVCHLGMWSC
jgi:hypothetical protein